MSNVPTNSDVPSLVLDYFGLDASGQDAADQVHLVQAFQPRHNGWTPLVPRNGTWQAILGLDPGVTALAFELHGRVADFRLEELYAYARRGAFAKPYYANRRPL
jgi:hypothetical protein